MITTRDEAIAKIVTEFKWAEHTFSYHDLPLLVSRVWDNLEKWTGSFEEFCIHHKALSTTGAVATANGIDKDGNPIKVPFAYPLFCAVKKAGDELGEQAAWEEEHTVDLFSNDLSAEKVAKFESLINEAPHSGVMSMLVGLDRFLKRNPNSPAAQKLRQKMVEKLRQTTNGQMAKEPQSTETVG